MTLFVCSKCQKSVKTVVMCRTFWTSKTGWVDAPWSACCDVRVVELRSELTT